MNKSHEQFFEDKMNSGEIHEFLKSHKTESDKKAFIKNMYQALKLKMC